MKPDTAAEFLIKKLNDQRSTLVGEIIRLPLPQEEYARIRGVIQGLDFAIFSINDIATKVENGDDVDMEDDNG